MSLRKGIINGGMMSIVLWVAIVFVIVKNGGLVSLLTVFGMLMFITMVGIVFGAVYERIKNVPEESFEGDNCGSSDRSDLADGGWVHYCDSYQQ
jgi:hypothetical protein